MNKLQLILLTATLFLCTNFTTQAQEKVENVSLSYTIKYSESDYKSMQQKVAKTGISTRDFGGWLANNGTYGMDMDWTAEGSDYVTTLPGLLIVFVINSQGNILGEQRISIKNPGRDSKLNRVINSSDLVSAVDRFFPGGSAGPFFPSDIFIPTVDSWFPSETFVTVVDGYRRMATNASQRAFRESRVGSDGVAIVLFAMPDPNMKVDSQSRVSPGGAVFVGTSSEK